MKGNRTAAPVGRRKRALETWANAAESIGPVEAGMSLFMVTRGQFSMIDVIYHILAELGGGGVSVWTWAIADYEVEVVTGLLEKGSITEARLIVDYSAGRRNANLLDDWRARFGEASVKVCKNHAKIARVWGGGLRVLVRGSFNLNFNPRFEQCDITEGGADYELVERVENELPVLPRRHSHQEAATASGVPALWDMGQQLGLKDFSAELKEFDI